jgi:DNA helicase HerA-like ATPase
MLIYNKLGKNKFLEALDIITQFPKEVDFNVNDNIISLLDEFPKTNKIVKQIVARLFEKNPSKYYDLRNKWLGNGNKS